MLDKPYKCKCDRKFQKLKQLNDHQDNCRKFIEYKHKFQGTRKTQGRSNDGDRSLLGKTLPVSKMKPLRSARDYKMPKSRNGR